MIASSLRNLSECKSRLYAPNLSKWVSGQLVAHSHQSKTHHSLHLGAAMRNIAILNNVESINSTSNITGRKSAPTAEPLMLDQRYQIDDALQVNDSATPHALTNLMQPETPDLAASDTPVNPIQAVPTPSTGEFLVNTYTASSVQGQAIAALNDGGFVVTWGSSGQNGDGVLGVYAQRFNASGVPVGGEIHVNTYTPLDQYYIMPTALADGGFIVTWASNGQDGDLFGIYAQRYDAAGATVGGEFRINTTTTGSQCYSAIAGLNDGGFLVTWTSDGQDGSSNGIYAQRYNASGGAVGGEFRINSTTSGSQESSKIAVLDNGDIVVIWSSSQNSPGFNVYAQRYSAAGVAIGGEFKVDTNTIADTGQTNPAIAPLDGGGFVISWQAVDGSGVGIFAQRYNASGVAVGPQFQVNTFISSNQSSSSITGLSDGGFLIQWQSNNQDGSGTGIYGKRYDASGAADGGEFLVNETTASTQTQALRSPQSLVQLTGGAVVSTWYGSGIGDSSGVFARMFSVGAVNQAPTVDLNGASTGINTTAAYTEDQAAVKMIQSVVVTDDGANLTGATVTIATGFVSGDILRVNGSRSGAIDGISYNYDDTTGVLTLTGSASVANYQSLLSSLAFKTLNDMPGTSRDITVTVTDGTATSTAAHIALAVTPVNDAPVNSVPGAQSVGTGGTITFSSANANSIFVSDPDAGLSFVRVKLEAEHGTITVDTSTNAIISGNGTGFVLLTGGTADINAALEGMTYHGAAGYVGSDSLRVSTNDRGGSGVGGQMTDNDSIAITLRPVTVVDAPIAVETATDTVGHNIVTAFVPASEHMLDHGAALASIGHELLQGTIFLG